MFEPPDRARRPVLEALDLVRVFKRPSAVPAGLDRLLGRTPEVDRAVDGVSFALGRGRTLAIVGESGSGKSTVARMLTGLMQPDSGQILIDGQDLPRRRKALGQRIQLVFQDPIGSLNPRRTVGRIIEGPLGSLAGLRGRARHLRMLELLDLVGLLPEHAERYPHEFSGGQCQRIAIARALAAEAPIIVLDEAVSALDVRVQAQILRMLHELQDELGLSYVFISHDLAVVEAMADEVLVMRRGVTVEHGLRGRLFASPQHAYTRELLDAVPRL